MKLHLSISFLKKYHQIVLALGICVLFSFLYTTLSVVRHNNFGSFGFDLGIVDQIVWKYSVFKSPITTPQHFPFTSLLSDHVELIFIVISPLYWIFSDARMLLAFQAVLLSFSALPLYLLAKRKKLPTILSYVLMISYLMFFGIQNALWFDVHSLTIAAGILPWYLYFTDREHLLGSIITFILAISCKEDIALFTAMISGIYFITRRKKVDLVFVILSVFYLFLLFFIYFPYFTRDGYRYDGEGGLLSNIDLTNFYNTETKRKIITYSLASFGFLPLLAPLYLLPYLSDLGHYFVIGHSVTAAQEFFMHYRVTLALFLVWPTIISIQHFAKYLSNTYIAVYLLLCALFFQYILHLPLSYLAKKWFWQPPASISTLNQAIISLPHDASIVSQNNITPHISHRDLIFTLWPDTKSFSNNSPCGEKVCRWFRWSGEPTYLIVDTSREWDIRHFLINREEYLSALSNMEKAGYITKDNAFNTTVIYKILKHPRTNPE